VRYASAAAFRQALDQRLKNEAAFARAAVFLDPVLAGHARGQWETQRREWLPLPP
jgi:hypothetical protein